jgi:hypothetical protein
VWLSREAPLSDDVHALLQILGHVQHLHPEEFTFGSELDGALVFPIWLTFPQAGTWYLHASATLTSLMTGRATTAFHRQVLHVGSSSPAQLPAQSAPPASKPNSMALLTTVVPNGSQRTSNHDSQMLQVPARHAAPGAMLATLQHPGGEVFRHDCRRFVLDFQDAETGKPVQDLEPWVHPSMHALVAAKPVFAAGQDAFALWEAHGWPEALDFAVFGDDKQHGLDPCNMQTSSAQAAREALAGQRFGPRLVLYLRFERGGPHEVFVQVCCH